MAAVRLICCAATFRPHPSNIPTHRNEVCACEGFLKKRGVSLIPFCPRHVRMTLQQINKHSRTPKHGLTKPQADRPPTDSLRKKHTQITLNVMYRMYSGTAIHTALSQMCKDTARLTNRLNVSCPSPPPPTLNQSELSEAGLTQCAYVNWHRRIKSAKHSSFLFWTVERNMFRLNKTRSPST